MYAYMDVVLCSCYICVDIHIPVIPYSLYVHTRQYDLFMLMFPLSGLHDPVLVRLDVDTKLSENLQVSNTTLVYFTLHVTYVGPVIALPYVRVCSFECRVKIHIVVCILQSIYVYTPPFHAINNISWCFFSTVNTHMC